MRERLIELFRKTEYQNRVCGTKANLATQFTEYGLNQIVDALLANGVIVPPCRVGDFIELKKGDGSTTLYRVNGFYYDPNDRGLRYIIDLCTPVIDNSSIVRIITKEEHEKALAEGGNR